jgi:RNA polymerase-binding transcription factor DksA
MADIADRANELVEHERAEALARFHAEQVRCERIAESMRPYDPTAPRICADCQEEIELDRVKALPLTGRCAHCAAVAEAQLRGRAPR